ncbi:MAG: DUF86 domain-containing protein [Chloroflexi bacterium]|nr:DUF86 domain-containing protein [Chloroflexota bacterium]
MSRDRQYLDDILDAARLARSYVLGHSLESFLADVQCQDAVMRRLEIIGEAARRLSDSTRGALPSLPWQQMIGMRNLLIHGYDAVELDIVWDTVRRDLPAIIGAIQKLLGAGGERD